MRIAVIGAGIIGVTTAFELASDGHEVVVYERQGSVAGVTSFAITGLMSPGIVAPWAAPGMPLRLLRSLVGKHSGLRLSPNLNPKIWSWLSQWRKASQRGPHFEHRAAMQRLALLSQQRFQDIGSKLKLDYEHTRGAMTLLRTAEELERVQPAIALMGELGIKHEVIDRDTCFAVEPGLNPETPLAGAIYFRDDQVANCRQYAHLLRTAAQQLGAKFHFHTDVERIVPGAKPQLVLRAKSSPDSEPPSILVDGSRHGFAVTQPLQAQAEHDSVDAVVVCAALGASTLLAPHGLKLPMLPVHGYSVTAPMRNFEAHPRHGPQSGIFDAKHQVAITRLGARIRVAGCHEIAGHRTKHDKAAIATLYRVLEDWFPGVARTSHAQAWRGARPMLPDGPPVLGASGIPGVWLNLGHGDHGWALACGSARVVSDLLASRQPAVDTSGFGVHRLHL
jgi:D-amino-acid dehydrogenase